MADTRFLSYTGLEEYDGLIKNYINTGLNEKSETSHIHDERYYTETEIDTKLSAINTNVDKITSGETVVSKATSATYATTATKAGTADKATSATKATNADTATYASSAASANKLGTSTVGSTTKPIYLNAGVATTCTTYAGGTKITLNGTNKGGSSAAIFAPTTGGTSGQVLKSAGTASAPVWETLDVYTKAEVDTALSNKSASTHNHDSKYDAKGASTAALADAKTYVDGKVKGMATTATVDNKISTHNSSTASHSDIRATLAAVKEDVDAFFKDATISTEAKDTLKEIQDYITSDASAAAEMTASIANKADKATYEAHAASTVSHITAAERTAWNSKADASHGTHVTWSTTSPKMNGTASVGSETKVARGDHVHPVDTSRAAKSDFDAHVASTVSHVTAAERTAWNAKASTANATTKTAGLMSSADKTKLDGIAEGANKYEHPTTSGNKHIPSGGASGQFLKWSADGTAVWAADNDTKYAAGTGIVLSGTTFSNSGVRSVVTGTKNGEIIVNTNGTTTAVPVKGLGASAYKGLDTSLSTTSTNPVQNKTVTEAINTATNAITANTNSITTLISAVNAIEEISKSEIEALFA